MPVNVLHYHDGIIHHEANRDGECHQRQVVETEIEQIHHRERAEQGQRHRDTRNKRCPEIAQEQQYDQNHQHDGQQQRELDVLHRGANRLGAILNDRDIDSGRNVFGQPRQLGLDLVDRFNDVGAGLFEHGEHDAGLAVLVGRERSVRGARDRLADVANPDRAAIAVGEDGIVKRRWVGNLIIGSDGEARSFSIDGTFCRDRGRTDKRFAHFLQRLPAGGKLRGVHLDAYRGMLLAEDDDLGDTMHLGNLLGHEIIGVVVDRDERQGVGLRGENHDR
jgi:hypothetical protein